MMLGGLVVLGFFLVAPAEGPFSFYGFPASVDQAHYLSHLHALRAGTLTGMDFGSVDGLITFPSFHTIWAILLTVAYRQPVARACSGVLNGVVILATLTTGWHYLSDVLAGILICLVICWASGLLERRLAGRVVKREEGGKG
jgi:membrane-associated phospholipid phosphatase